MIYIILTALLIFLTVIEKPIIKKFDIKNQKGFYKPVNKIHQWSEITLIISLIIIIYFISMLRQYFLPIFSTVVFGFRAFMEWKYEKNSKTYILSILNGSRFLVLIILINMFLRSK
ncbi:DUF4181 domain-containing protein [Alkaliphilus peptidifermentans]|uniref:DUF4181 domain-containing protein n=1 Tax=Alkaliphilus peptidifermentans DSM 18978 TaxID=1120976 RepID=A0A1G5GWR4_9FIRM|nr:DUF4181 domain-containing protein [Alkaliphilus peptidifermentans]SCY55600.1 protein of unknown function [Alkaliphilus peptidifermentans DSM 18978]